MTRGNNFHDIYVEQHVLTDSQWKPLITLACHDQPILLSSEEKTSQVSRIKILIISSLKIQLYTIC